MGRNGRRLAEFFLAMASARPAAPTSPWQQRVSPEHRDAILEVLALQRGLVEINFKLSETQKENADMTKDIEGLSEYIDSLM